MFPVTSFAGTAPLLNRPRTSLWRIALFGTLVSTSLAVGTAHAATTRVTTNPMRGNTNFNISADGTKVVFSSQYENLVPNDTNNLEDVFVYDLTTGVTKLVSVSSDGTQANQQATNPSISADGTKVAFQSDANNLVDGDTNGTLDIFVHDLTTGITTRASEDSTGLLADSGSVDPMLNADGTKVVFTSSASNLVSGDTNATADVFMKDLLTGAVTLVSLGNGGVQANDYSEFPSVSADGTKIVFLSQASNLVSGDTNAASDVFVRDLTNGTTTRVSVDSNGNQADGGTFHAVISADGTKVAFNSYANNLQTNDADNDYDIFVHDLNTHLTTCASVGPNGEPGNNGSIYTSLSADGTKLAFTSGASNLVPGDTNGSSDIFVRNLTTGVTTRINLGIGGAQANEFSDFPSLSANGNKVSYYSEASNLISGDTNGSLDLFVSDVATSNAPTAITLTRQSILEHSGANAFVAGLSATDADANETFTYSLPTGVGDNAAFSISGTNLRTAQDFDVNTKSSYSITLRVTDSTGNTYDQPFTITVLEAVKPVVTISAPSANAKLQLTDFVAGVLNGTATDNAGVITLKVRLSRKRNDVNTYWNGTSFVTSQSTVDAVLNGSTWSLTNVPPAAKLDAGAYAVQVYATDAAGNKSAYAERTFTLLQPIVDKTAPNVAISTPAVNSVLNINNLGPGTFTGTASDDTGVTAVKIKVGRRRNNVWEYWNGSTFTTTVVLVNATYSNGTWSYNSPIPANQLDKGGYTLYATAYDAAGNFKTTSSRIFTLNGTATASDIAPILATGSSAGQS